MSIVHCPHRQTCDASFVSLGVDARNKPGFAKSIKNQEIVEELSLPPVKVHCSVLAEDAIKAAVSDWETKQAKQGEAPAAETQEAVQE